MPNSSSELGIRRSRLGRIIRDMCKIEGQPALQEVFALPLGRATQIRSAAAAPARLQALFLPCPGGGVHRQGQGRRALRVRSEGLTSSPTTAGLPVACSCCTPGRCPITRTRSAIPCGTSLTVPKHTPAVRSNGPKSTRDTAATTRQSPFTPALGRAPVFVTPVSSQSTHAGRPRRTRSALATRQTQIGTLQRTLRQ